MRNGKSIFSGCDDGKIRTFLPQLGKLLYCINEAHINGVTAITATSDCRKIVSGGMNGEIRVWRISPYEQKMEASIEVEFGILLLIPEMIELVQHLLMVLVLNGI